jgi:Protein of unknown function (DUF3040)
VEVELRRITGALEHLADARAGPGVGSRFNDGGQVREAIMLNREDQRRLAEIERHLEHDDPKLARRMRPGGRRGRWLIFLVPVLSTAVALLALTNGWVVASGAAMVATAAATLAIQWRASHWHPRGGHREPPRP